MTQWYSVDDLKTSVNASGSCINLLLHAQYPGAGWAGAGVQGQIHHVSGVCHASGFPGPELISLRTKESDLIATRNCHCQDGQFASYPEPSFRCQR